MVVPHTKNSVLIAVPKFIENFQVDWLYKDTGSYYIYEVNQYSRWLGDVPKQTRGWDESAQVTRAQRSKEESSDYRYFPEPDLIPVTTTDEDVERVRGSLGELPTVLRTRLEEA